MLASRLTLSIKTSLPKSKPVFSLGLHRVTDNSSKQRIGAPIASHRESKKQICEKDFSPPDKVLV